MWPTGTETPRLASIALDDAVVEAIVADGEAEGAGVASPGETGAAVREAAEDRAVGDGGNGRCARRTGWRRRAACRRDRRRCHPVPRARPHATTAASASVERRCMPAGPAVSAATGVTVPVARSTRVIAPGRPGGERVPRLT